jgi:coproporphyrinogen III oxidase-like Fe-S oxidoreductase
MSTHFGGGSHRQLRDAALRRIMTQVRKHQN